MTSSRTYGERRKKMSNHQIFTHNINKELRCVSYMYAVYVRNNIAKTSMLRHVQFFEVRIKEFSFFRSFENG